MATVESSSIREAIRSANRFTRMRAGQMTCEFVEFPSVTTPSGDALRVAQVPLTEYEAQQGVIAAANLEVADNFAGMTARNRAALLSDVWHSLREPSDLTRKAFESVEEMAQVLEPTDIDLASDSLTTLMDYASPAIDGLSDKDLVELKKAFAKIDWSALSGRRWAAVKQCCLILVPELLQAKLSGFSSTESSTTKSGNGEST